jgi:hypothetical protein
MSNNKGGRMMNGSDFSRLVTVLQSLVKPELRIALREVIRDTDLTEGLPSGGGTPAEKEAEVVKWITEDVSVMVEELNGLDNNLNDIEQLTMEWRTHDGWVFRNEPWRREG